MLSPRKFAAGKKFLQRWQKAKKTQARRGLRTEALERRELMANDFSPGVTSALATMLFTSQAGYEQAGRILQARANGGTPGGSGASSGEQGTPHNANEVEANNTLATANFLPLGNTPDKTSVVNVTGTMANLWDEDFYAFDLKKGDILNVRLTTPGNVPGNLTLYNAAGQELLFSDQLFYPPAVGRPLPTKSPLFTNGASTVAYVIDTDGRYFLSVNDAGLASYTLNLRTYRPTIEAEPVGTKQKIFLDFNGSFIRTDMLSIDLLSGNPPTTARVSPLSRFLPQLGLTAADEPAVVRNISARVENILRTRIAAASLNGFYGQSGVPGEFDVEILNSTDHVDVWGQPNVSRIVVGGTNADFGIPPAIGLLGIAESIDIGNFNRENTALVMLDILVQQAPLIPRAGNIPVVDAFAQFVADVIAHEAGHYLGAMHQDPTSAVDTLMDPAYNIVGIVGPDGLFGTADDRPLIFRNDDYRPGETTAGGGVNNSPQLLAFGMSTGKVGATISGVAYNDLNRNGLQDSGEAGIAGWEVFVDINNNGVRDSSEPRAVTGATGAYVMTAAAGTYNVRINRAASWIPSISTETFKTVTVGASGTATANFGSFLPSAAATGFKWLDINADGIRDAGEPGLAGVYIYVDVDGDDRPDIGEPAAITGTDGSYNLTPPAAGTYAIREVVAAGYRQTFPNVLTANGEHIVTFDGVTPLRGLDFGNTESADWGDAPSPYLTTRAQGGPSHGVTDNLRLGVNWDAEQDGRPSNNADGDDTNGTVDDEDGVSLLVPLVRGDASNIIQISVFNNTGTVAYVQGWIDFNGDGDWSDAGEQVATNLLVASGATASTQNVSFSAPANAVSRGFARFRLSQEQNLGPNGRSATGEVEDYVFNIVDGPRALLQPDSVQVARNSTSNIIDVLANDFAIPGETWTITGVTTSSRGVLPLIQNNRINYKPPVSFIGIDQFDYTATSNTGRVATARVTVSVVAQFVDPVAVDDSFDLPTNSISFPLSVLANDVEGAGGALVVTNVTTPSQGGTVTIGSGGQSIRYTPRRGFGGTEMFSYTATDATGKSTTANITVHTLAGDRLDDDVEFSFDFFDTAGNRITEIQQGQEFQVGVFVDDLRPEKGAAQVPPVVTINPGVFSAYLDILYSAGLVAPVAPPTGSLLDFRVSFASPYTLGQDGTARTPGIIDEFGAFASLPNNVMDEAGRLRVATLRFTATNPGLAEFVGDPADRVPQSDVTFFNSSRAAVPEEQIRYGRSILEIVPSGVDFPYAMDDSPARIPAGLPATINVLANDLPGTQPPIRISSATQGGNGQVVISDNGTPTIFSDDRIIYTPATNFTGTDEFKYTITDQRGFTSTATVTLQVGTQAQVEADDLIQLRLSVWSVPTATDPVSREITEITVGQPFQLRGYVKDLRTTPVPVAPGVFAAYQDVQFNANLARVNTSSTDPFFQVAYSADYQNATSGDSRIVGLLNELGSAQTLDTPLGQEERLQWTVTFTAASVGVANFIGNPADIKPFHDSLLFEPTTPLLVNQIRFITDSVIIRATGGGGGSGEGFTNLSNPYDVNNDGFVSPIDVLILVNALNSGAAGPLGTSGSGGSGEGTEKFYVDVNADSFLSPLDALAVINQINTRIASGRGGAAEGEDDSSDATPVIVANALGNTLVDVPFATRSTIDSVASMIYGPMMYGEDEEESDELSLADYLASIGQSEDDDYLDGLAKDLLS